MTKQMLLCLTNSPLHAHHVVEWLKQEGFLAKDISACVPEKNALRGLIGETQDIGHVGGAGPSGTPGMMEDSRRHVTVLGRNLLKRAKSISKSFGESPSLAGLLISKGLPESAARSYEVHLNEGGILISVNTGSQSRLRRAREILQMAGTQSIAETQKKGRPMLRPHTAAA